MDHIEEQKKEEVFEAQGFTVIEWLCTNDDCQTPNRVHWEQWLKDLGKRQCRKCGRKHRVKEPWL